jgi:hypothetical protein
MNTVIKLLKSKYEDDPEFLKAIENSASSSSILSRDYVLKLYTRRMNHLININADNQFIFELKAVLDSIKSESVEDSILVTSYKTKPLYIVFCNTLYTKVYGVIKRV